MKETKEIYAVQSNIKRKDEARMRDSKEMYVTQRCKIGDKYRGLWRERKKVTMKYLGFCEIPDFGWKNNFKTAVTSVTYSPVKCWVWDVHSRGHQCGMPIVGVPNVGCRC
jgi:hypothetical protein